MKQKSSLREENAMMPSGANEFKLKWNESLGYCKQLSIQETEFKLKAKVKQPKTALVLSEIFQL